jgi:putative PEP-CTERM system TPR-repeat lipoprotein
MVSHPGNAAAMELLAQSQLAAGDKDNAIVSFTKLTALAPQYADAHFQLAKLQIDRKNLSAARSTLVKAVAIKPDFYEALYTLAMLEVDAKRPEEALKIARDAQSRAPKSPAGLILQGDVQMRLGKHAEAAQSFEKALAMADMGPVQIKLHQALRRSGQAQAADERLQQWLKAHPRDVGARYYLGEVHMQARNYRQAIDLFKAVVQLAPQNAMAMNNLAWLYDQGRNPLALQTAEQAYKLSPSSAAVQDTLGWILLREGKTARSLELLRQAAASKDPNIQFHYAAALAKSGDKEKARSLLKQLLASNRNFAEAKQAEALLKQL